MRDEYQRDDRTPTPDPDTLDGIRAALERDFDPSMIDTRKIGGGRQVTYLTGSAVISRLNHAAPEWSLRVVERWKETLDVNRWNEQERKTELVERDCSCMIVEMTIPGLGTRTGLGVQVLEPGGGEDPLKGVLTDATKNAAKQFGVGLTLYGKIEREDGAAQPAGDGSHSATSGGQTAPPPANPDYQRANSGGNGPMQPSEAQQKLIDMLRDKLGLDDAQMNAVCTDATGYPIGNIGKKSASTFIDALKEIEAGNAQVPATSAGQTPPQSSGTGGTGATTDEPADDVTVARWLKTIEGAKTIKQLEAMQEGLTGANLMGNAKIAEALSAAEARIENSPGQAANGEPF